MPNVPEEKLCPFLWAWASKPSEVLDQAKSRLGRHRVFWVGMMLSSLNQKNLFSKMDAQAPWSMDLHILCCVLFAASFRHQLGHLLSKQPVFVVTHCMTTACHTSAVTHTRSAASM